MVDGSVTLKRKIYHVNGKQYDSLEAVPEEFRDLLSKFGGMGVTGSGVQSEHVFPTQGVTASKISLVKYSMYFAVQGISLAENIVINDFARSFGVLGNTWYLIIISSLVVGHISNKLAEFEINKKNNVFGNVVFTGDISFINDIVKLGIAGKYSLLLYLGYYFVWYLISLGS